MFDRLKMLYFLGLLSGAYSDLNINKLPNEFEIDDEHGLNTEQAMVRVIITIYFFNKREQGNKISCGTVAGIAAKTISDAGLLHTGETFDALSKKLTSHYISRDFQDNFEMLFIPESLKGIKYFKNDRIRFIKSENDLTVPLVDESYIQEIIAGVAKYKITSQSPETKEDSHQTLKIREQVIKEYLLKHLYKKEENGTYASRSHLGCIYYHLENIFIIANEDKDKVNVKKPKKFGTMVIDLPENDPRTRTIYDEEIVVDITEQEFNAYVKLLAENKYHLNEELLKHTKQSSQVENKTESFGLWGTKTTTNLNQDKAPTTKPMPTRFRDKI